MYRIGKKTLLWIGLQTGCGKSIILAMVAYLAQKFPYKMANDKAANLQVKIATSTELLSAELKARYFNHLPDHEKIQHSSHEGLW